MILMEAVAAVAPLNNDLVKALIVLTIVQALILAGVLVGVWVMLARTRQLVTKVAEQIDEVQSLVANQVQPVLTGAHSAMTKLEAVADGALRALQVTEPLVHSVAQISGAVQKRTTPVWMDLLRLASAVFFTVRANKVKKKAAQHGLEANGMVPHETLEGTKNE